MPTAPVSPNPNRNLLIIIGVLGIVVVCLFISLIVSVVYFLRTPPPPAAVKPLPTPTRVSLILPSPSPFPTQEPAPATPVIAEPTPTPEKPTATVTRPVPTRPPASPTVALPRGKIAFSKCEERCDKEDNFTVWIMNADGTGATKVLDKAGEPAISPDGTKIAYYHFSDGIFVAGIDGTGAKKIIGDTYTESVQWSHDGRLLAFGTRPTLQGNIASDVVAPDGSGRRGVAVGRSPAWSPDDTQIAYDTCRGNDCGIYRSSAAGGQEAIPVTRDGGGLPSWSPDGKKILYQADVDGQKQLFLVNPDGSGRQQLTHGGSVHVGAAWSSDGNYIFYRSPEGGSWAIWRMKADGTNPTKLLDNVPPVDWAFERITFSK